MKSSYPYYLANEPRESSQTLPVTDKYTGTVVTHVAEADAQAVAAAIAAAHDAAPAMRKLKAYQRRDILDHCADVLKNRRDELAMALCIEAGKPIRDSRGEVARLIDTFRIAAQEATRIGGEVIPLDINERTGDTLGMTRRVPIGPCTLITPFNFPLNLVAHKIAPAIAAGCPFILKPSPNTPLGALLIGEVLAEMNLPPGAFSILTCSNDAAAPLIEDDRIKLLSFTGSDKVGWSLKARAGKKRVLLELGGNAGVIVDRDADLADAVQRIIHGTFYQSGQSCISVQRIYAHEQVYDAFREQLVEAASRVVMGDPKQEETVVGPMIGEKEAIRVHDWMLDAMRLGGTLLCGGGRDGVMVQPTLLEDVPEDADLCAKEAFGPVAVLTQFSAFSEALAAVNRSRFGLQAGVFTRDLGHAHQAWDELEVGGVIVGDVPSWRVDHMPYGGVKDSGLGREGPRYAIDAMTEIRLLVLRG